MMERREAEIFGKKKAAKKHIFCICAALFLFLCNNLVLKKISGGDLNRFFRWHFNDLICPLFFLGYCQIVWIWIKDEVRSYPLLIAAAMSARLVWEYFAPLINPKAVSDPLDLLCYFIGANICYLMTKRE